jgi:GDP/UDP-N,N'-diacetylbacillosamine 2-epimerase (hydrolysing)
MRKVCVVTGTRAEYGLLRGVIQGVLHASGLKLQLVVTGMHLAPEFGMTYREIESDGLRIDERVEMLVSADTASGTAKSMGLGLIGLGDAFARLKPDIIVLLGDRFEILAAASAALVASIPVAHVHGGETTEGAFDESIRHAVTKMSHLHFVAAEEYRQRVIQLGEQPSRVHLVGGLGVDAIKQTRLLSRAELESSLGIDLGPRHLLVTFHPETLERSKSESHMAELLAALGQLSDTRLVFTLPNADTGSSELRKMVETFVAGHANAVAFASLGQQRYLSCMKLAAGVVGNSSSGLMEAPSLGVGTINIGNRQQGRVKADSVIDCAPDRDSILRAIRHLEDPLYQKRLERTVNPYGDGGASQRIVQVLHAVSLEGILQKAFHQRTPSHLDGHPLSYTAPHRNGTPPHHV